MKSSPVGDHTSNIEANSPQERRMSLTAKETNSAKSPTDKRKSLKDMKGSWAGSSMFNLKGKGKRKSGLSATSNNDSRRSSN